MDSRVQISSLGLRVIIPDAGEMRGFPGRLGDTICSDGYVYRYGRRAGPWLIVIGQRYRVVTPADGLFHVWRRKITLQRAEMLRWRYLQYLDRVVVVRSGAIAQRLHDNPGAYTVMAADGNQYFSRYWTSVGDFGGIVVNNETEPVGPTLIERAAAEADTPERALGERYEAHQAWSSARWQRSHRYDTLLGALLVEYRDQYLLRLGADSKSYDRRHTHLTVNGRTYTLIGKDVFGGVAVRRNPSWPRPDDLYINVDDAPTFAPVYYGSEMMLKPYAKSKSKPKPQESSR